MIRDEKMRGNLVNFFSFVIETLVHVIRLFYIEKKYEEFDPHVGDTACQIRACLISVFAKDSIDKSLAVKRTEELKILYNKLCVYQLTFKSNTTHEKNNNYTVRELADKIGIHFFLSDEEKIIFQSYFLTRFKKETPLNTVIDYDTISLDINLSRKVSKKLARHYQLSLASHSCEEIIRWASTDNQYNLDSLKALQRSDDDERQVLPCYLFTKIIYSHALKEGIPILVISKLKDEFIPIYFKPNPTRSGFIYHDDLRDELHKACIVITGCSQAQSTNYLQRFINTGIKNIILSAMASHPQYSGQKLATYGQDIFQDIIDFRETHYSISDELITMRRLASSLGCCYTNPSLFVVNHIFCGTVYTQCLRFKLAIEELLKKTDTLKLQ